MNATYLDIHLLPELDKDYALLLGTFDGVHLGHKGLLDVARKYAQKVAVLIIYSNFKSIKEHQKSGYLMNLNDRVKRFEELGVNDIYLLNLRDDLLTLSPNEFVSQILLPLAPKCVVVGEDFRFGHNALGHAVDLESISQGKFETYVVSPWFYKGEKISTTLIKKALLEGKNDDVKHMLGNYYSLNGLITKGYGLGSKIGFPTANVLLDPSYFLPRHGVYLVKVQFNGISYFGMASLGYHPTVNEVKLPLLEVNIFDFEEDLYGKAITVTFVRFLRKEEKYENLDLLVQKIKEDRALCLKIISEGEI